MINDTIQWRMWLIDAVIQLQSGAVDSYAVILGAESFGEDSDVMNICRGVLSQMGITNAELKLWEESYKTKTTHPLLA